MLYDADLIACKLRRWEKFLNNYRLPEWENIPDIGLYMEQVIALLKGYLDYLPPELKEEQFITPVAINNYVRRRIIPEPVKKKYYRVHIAYLIILCSLKQSLSLKTLKELVPVGLSAEELKAFYTAFTVRHRLSAQYFVRQVREAASGILGHENGSELSTASTEELIVSSAVVSGFAGLLAEKLLLLSGVTAEEAAAREGS